jgi:hypothetical protein
VSLGNDAVLRDVRAITCDSEYTPTSPQELAGLTNNTMYFNSSLLSRSFRSPGRIFHTAYMGTVNSSDATRSRAAALAKEVRVCLSYRAHAIQ